MSLRTSRFPSADPILRPLSFSAGPRWIAGPVVVILLGATLAVAPAVVAGQVGVEDFDARGARDQTAASPGRAPSAAQQDALSQLRAGTSGDVVVRWSSLTGAPSRILARSGALSSPSSASALISAERFVQRIRALLKLSADDLKEMRVSRDYRTEANGVHHLSLQQQANGIDVWGGEIKINVDAEGRILGVSGEPMPRLSAIINTAEPAITSARAVQLAGAFAGIDRPEASATADLVYFPLASDNVRLGWRFVIDDTESADVYESIVDAVDGRVLWRKNLTSYDHFPAHGDVYTSDSPIPQTPKGSGGVVVSRVDVPFNGTGFFPHDDPHFDWWNGGPRTTTTSNNVDAYADRDGDDAPDPGSRPVVAAGEDFFFPIDLSMDPLTYQPAAVTNLFYWNNRMHDWLYSLGFDEAAGNFQSNNFGLGGSGDDPVMAEAQDNRDGAEPSLCNANFSTPGDGSSPRMQMFQCNSAVPERDGDLDANVIGHEYGHGVHSRLVATSGNQRGNEGWSDYFGLSLTAEPDDPYGGAYGVGDYLFNLNGDGIRSDPYSTDPTIYKRSYADINDASTSCQVKTCSDDPTETCNEDSDCSGNPPATCVSLGGCKFHEDCRPPNTAIDQSPCRSQVHRTGELWANALWVSRMNLIGKYGFATGARTMNRLVVDGMKLSPADPTFLDGRDAILMADQVNNGGANTCLIWDGFARMGMGYSALTSGVLDLNPIESFDVPTPCAAVLQVSADPDLGTVCEGDTATRQLQVFNTGGGDLIITSVARTAGSDAISVDPFPETPVFVGAGSHVSFTVSCSPMAAGEHGATITVATNDTATPQQDVVFSCIGGAPDLQVSIADSGYFGEACSGSFADLDLSLYNQGTCDLVVDAISVDNPLFELPASVDFPLVLHPGSDFIMAVRFTPTACSDAAANAILEIDSNDPDTAHALIGVEQATPTKIFADGFESGDTLEWSGPGARRHRDPVFIGLSGSAPCPKLVLDPAGLGELYSFPPTVVDSTGALGCSSDRMFALRNNSSCPLTIDDISAAGADFSVIAPSAFPVLLPGGEETLSVTVRFTPQSDVDPYVPSEVTGSLTVVSDDPDGPAVADLCGESAAQSGVRILVTDVSSGTPVPVDEVDLVTVKSNGVNTPGPINLRFTDVPASMTQVCGNDVWYHVDQEDLPETSTTGNNPMGSYESKAKEGNIQSVDTYGLEQCEMRVFQLQLSSN